MGSATSKFPLLVGLAACLGAGVAVSVSQFNQPEDDSAQARLKESRRKIRAAQLELEAAQKVKVQLDDSQRHSECLRTELEARRTEAKETAATAAQYLVRAEAEESQRHASQRRVKILEAEVMAVRKEVDETYHGAVANEAAQHAILDQVEALKSERDEYAKSADHAASLQVELEATRKIATSVNKKAQQELEAACSQLEPLKAERDTLVEQHTGAQRRLRSLEEEQDQMQRELARGKLERRHSLSELNSISEKLESVGTSWSPWNDLNDIKGKVERMRSVSNANDDIEALRGA